MSSLLIGPLDSERPQLLSYSLMDVEQNKIIDSQLVQVCIGIKNIGSYKASNILVILFISDL